MLGKPPAKKQLTSTVIDKKDISESEIKIVEEEFDVSLPEPIVIEGVVYLSMPQGVPIISIQLSGITKSDFVETHVPYSFDLGVGVDKHGDKVWIESIWGESEQFIMLKKTNVSTPEMRTLIGLDDEDEVPTLLDANE
jgi:hypothetical protein